MRRSSCLSSPSFFPLPPFLTSSSLSFVSFRKFIWVSAPSETDISVVLPGFRLKRFRLFTCRIFYVFFFAPLVPSLVVCLLNHRSSRILAIVCVGRMYVFGSGESPSALLLFFHSCLPLVPALPLLYLFSHNLRRWVIDYRCCFWHM